MWHHPGTLRLAARRLLDGDRPWGSIEIRSDRFGVTRCRLVVYPPGISDSERRRVRVARGWLLWGVMLWVLCEMWASQLTGPWTALAISTAVFLGTRLVAVAVAGDSRARVRTLDAAAMVGRHDPVSAAAVDKVKSLAVCLIEADDCLRDGRLSPTEHEMIWWGVYDEIGSGRPTATAA